MLDIPYVPLDEKTKERHMSVLRTGNCLIRKWAEFFKSGKAFRKLLFKDKKLVLEVIPKKFHKDFALDLPQIMAVRNIEWDMLCGFINIANKLARRWSRMDHGTDLDFGEFQQEAAIKLVDAIYGYTKFPNGKGKNTQFSTYAWWAVCRHLAATVDKNHPLRRFTPNERALLSKYEKARAEVNGPISFDELIAKLKYTPEQVRTLTEMMVKATNHSQMVMNTSDESSYDNGDVSALRRNVENDLRFGPDETWEIRDALDKADLTPFERAVVVTSMSPYYGWQEDVASKFVNPRNDKRYTRAAVPVVLEQAYRKIRRYWKAA